MGEKKAWMVGGGREDVSEKENTSDWLVRNKPKMPDL